MRPFQSLKIDELEEMFMEHNDEPDILDKIARELGLRKTKRAEDFRQRVVQRIAVGFRDTDIRVQRDQTVEEERVKFNALSPSDQQWIRLALDMRSFPPENFAAWQSVFHDSTLLAANDTFSRTVTEAAAAHERKQNEYQCFSFQPMIEAALFSLRHGKCSSFASFRFLHERLFGGAMRPFLPSVFSACSVHPEIVTGDPIVLLSAADWQECQNVEEPVWLPA